MKTARSAWMLMTALLAAAPAPAQTQAMAPPGANCDVKATVSHYQRAAALGTGFSVTGSTCTSLRNVVGRLLGTAVSAGKKLEPDRGLDLAAAARERREAQAEAEFAAALQQAQAGEREPLRLLLVEAALHEEFGHYAARDLVLRDARALLEK